MHQPRIVAVLLLTGLLLGCAAKPEKSADVEQPASTSAGEAASVNGQQPQPATTGDRYDVLVVGAGISGLTTALELGRGGARVLVVDMSSVFGGHAVMSQGGVCIVDTPTQRAAGLKDSPDLAYRDFITWGENADPYWVRYYVDHSRRDIYDWLTDLKVEFEGVLPAPGNTVDRFHQPKGRGIGLVTPIYRACLENGNVRFAWNTRAVKLIIDKGRVAGAVTRDERTGTERPIRARAVVLATGGFQSNLDMVRRYWPREFRFPEKILIGSGRNSTGSGHAIAKQAGGAFNRMTQQWNYFTGIPDPRLPASSRRGLSAANMHGIIVNADGQRFANLHNWAKEVMPVLLKQKRATLWFVFDESSKSNFTVSGSDWADFNTVDRLILKNPKLVKTAGNIGELAEKAGLPREKLIATIQRYNALVKSGIDTDFHRFGPKRPESVNRSSPPIATPPFYAMQAYPITRKSMGGVAIDHQCRVVDVGKKPIPGLYAVGELTGEAGINGKAALEGTFLGPCILTGRVAGRAVLKELTVKPTKTAAKSANCTSCHKLQEQVVRRRRGYWHFENVHRQTLRHRMDCLRCHAELAPYRRDHHRINRRALSATCAWCHRGRE